MASVNRRSTTRGVRYDVRYRTPTGDVRNKTFATGKEADRSANTVEADKYRGDFVDPRLAVSGREMLAALIAGERDPDTLAELSKGRLRTKIPQLREALRGRFREHHATILKITMDHVAQLEAAIASLDTEIDQVMVPFLAARDRLAPRPGPQAAPRGPERRSAV